MTAVSTLFNKVLSRLSPQRPNNSRRGWRSRSPSPRRLPSPTDNNNHILVEMGDSTGAPVGDSNPTTVTVTVAGVSSGTASATSNSNSTSSATGAQNSGRVTQLRTRAGPSSRPRTRPRARDSQAATQTNGTSPNLRPSSSTDGRMQGDRPDHHARTGSGRRCLGTDSINMINGNARMESRSVDQTTGTTDGMLQAGALSSRPRVTGDTSQQFHSAEQVPNNTLLGR